MRAIASLNELTSVEFAQALRPLFEAAEPLANALYSARPFASYEELIDRAEALANAMSPDDHVAVLSAHPRIGASPAELSAFSYREQGYANQAAADVRELERLAALNREYEKRLGFRFVVFVNKRPRAELIPVFEARLHNAREQELRTGLHEMFLIARDRLTNLSA